jgi:uncharacterized protein YfaS (alpha-2-macroglobulin family)
MADEKTKPRVQVRNTGPRPAYLLLNQPLPEGFEVVGSTRKAEEALEAIDSGSAAAYARIMIK